MRTHDAAAFQLRVQFDSTARELEKLRRENTIDTKFFITLLTIMLMYRERLSQMVGNLSDYLEFIGKLNYIIDQFDEMLDQARRQPLVMGVALHPYLVGQPYRLRHLRRALQHIATARDQGTIWLTTPGQIAAHMQSLSA